MKSGKTLFSLTILIALFFAGCNLSIYNWNDDDAIKGDGHVVDDEREAVDFNGVVLTGVGNVIINLSDEYRVVVTTDSNIQELIFVDVKNNLLNISNKSNTSIRATELTINVYLPKLEIIRVSGVGNIEISDGSAPELKIELSGVGNINAQNYNVENITITHSGVGNAKVWAVNSLRGTLSGVGNILYKGNPTINVRRIGVGVIKRL